MSRNAIGTSIVGSLPRVFPKGAVPVVENVTRMKAVGLSHMSDGEWSKPSYVSYIAQRCDGFGGKARSFGARDLIDFPNFAKQQVARKSVIPVENDYNIACIGEVRVKDRSHLDHDISMFISALRDLNVPGDLRQHFLTSASPGVITLFLQNKFYASHEEYLARLVEVMREEYEQIAASGLTLQIDCPDLAMGKNLNYSKLTIPEFRKIANLHVDALNDACVNIPAEQLRLHLCWGNWEGPHHHDIDLPEIWDIVMRAKPKYLLLESANPRHAHQVGYFETKQLVLPDCKVLVPGVIDSTSNYIEHPQLVARRISEWIRVLGRERVIAGTDCGFGTFDCVHTVHPDIVWPKLQSLCDGAAIASRLPN